ncbi:hypothetical protein [Brevibacillus choshinensis]|uniref:hypothetical protein n=1 Tax=Brevibacillus choshinensis TaxID=54911 RepID=UPI002E1D3DAF|nr:hypothetical protein [Brevibacillus choshinensis]
MDFITKLTADFSLLTKLTADYNGFTRYLIGFFVFFSIRLLILTLNDKFNLGNKVLRFIQKIPDRVKIKQLVNRALLLTVLISVQVVLAVRYVISSFAKFLIGSTFWGLTFLFAIILVTFSISESFILFKPITLLFNMLDSLAPDDVLVKTVISNITNVIGIFLPISITLYVFAYREQKASSVSGIYSRNMSLVVFFIFSVVAITYGKLLVYLMSPLSVEGTFYSTYLQSGRITVWGLLSFTAIVFGIKMVKETIRSVNIRWLLHDLNEEIKNTLFNLLFAWSKKQRQTLYPICHMYIESIYQLFSVAIEKNMNEVYEINYNRWTGFLSKLFEAPRFNFVDNTTRYEYLLSKEKSEFQGLYKSILRNHISLILTLAKNNKIEESHKAIATFFELMPRSTELNSYYLTSLHELALLLVDDSAIGIDPILNGIEEISSNPEMKHGLVLIYKALLIRGTQKNDVKAISSFAYSLSKCIEKEEFSLEQEKVDEAFERLTEVIGQNIKSSNFSQVNTVNITSTLKNAGIFVLLQATLKSIELAHYASTGFLIKFMVTNYESDIFNFTFKMFCRNKGTNNPFITQREEYSKIYVSFSFNDKTLEYCTKKMVILVYGQQRYVKDNELNFGCIPGTYVDKNLASCTYLDHLFETIKKAGDKYGLIFPIDDMLRQSLSIE